METKELIAQWRFLLNEPGNGFDVRGVLQKKLDILHRLNELGVRDIDGLSIFTAMDSTNVLMMETDKQARFKTLPA
jgi:hypothetical protein